MARRDVRRPAVSLAIALAILGLATSCSQSGDTKAMFTNTVDWTASPTAPRDYPAFVVAGVLTLGDGKQTPVPSGKTVNGGWGVVGPIDLVGEDGKPAPVKLDLAWYSFLEDKFWRLSSDLPREQIEGALRSEMLQPETGKPVPYDTLIIGMAPGGHASLWVSAGRVVRQIGTLQAGPADFPLEAVSNNPEQGKQAWVEEMLGAALAKEELAAVRERPVPLGRWQAWDQRYGWQPQVIGRLTGDTLWVTGLNGEVDWFDLSGKRQPQTSAPGQLSAPRALELSWRGADGAERVADIAIDGEESAAAFKAMAGRARGAAMALVVEPNDVGDRVEILLRAGDEIYRFKKVESKIMKR